MSRVTGKATQASVTYQTSSWQKERDGGFYVRREANFLQWTIIVPTTNHTLKLQNEILNKIIYIGSVCIVRIQIKCFYQHVQVFIAKKKIIGNLSPGLTKSANWQRSWFQTWHTAACSKNKSNEKQAYKLKWPYDHLKIITIRVLSS